MKTPVDSDDVMPMEQLPINNNGGQGYGFILYQTELPRVPKEIVIEQALDRAQVIFIFCLNFSALNQKYFYSEEWLSCFDCSECKSLTSTHAISIFRRCFIGPSKIWPDSVTIE